MEKLFYFLLQNLKLESIHLNLKASHGMHSLSSKTNKLFPKPILIINQACLFSYMKPTTLNNVLNSKGKPNSQLPSIKHLNSKF